MGANQLLWQQFLLQRAQEAKEREKYSKYHERAEDASVAYKFILSKHSRNRRFGSALRYSSINSETTSSLYSTINHNVGTTTGVTRRRENLVSATSTTSTYTNGGRATLVDFSNMASYFAGRLESENDNEQSSFDSADSLHQSLPPIEQRSPTQSPINLLPHLAVFSLTENPALNINYNLHVNYEIINVGYTILISFRNRRGALTEDRKASICNINSLDSPVEPIPSSKSFISGGILGDRRYQLIEVWFHWGKEDTRGSEHTVNYKAYPMEIQLIHWNSEEFSTYEEALGCKHGVVATCVFVQIGRENHGFNTFMDLFNDVHFMMQSKTVNEPHWLNPNCFLPDDKLRDYWSYLGSTTFPPISEEVIWIIYRYPLIISPNQLSRFRTLRAFTKDDLPDCTEGQMCDNFRPVQLIGERVVASSFT